jgi:hypothetical protein
VQPTPITCQSTVLKMMAAYLETRIVLASTGAAECSILDIWKDINENPDRPIKARNAHANMKWWLEKYFTSLKFKYLETRSESTALESIVKFIDSGFPVLVSVSHSRVHGHIILIIGYDQKEIPLACGDFSLVAHDPYGRFDPSLSSSLFGKKRFTGGACLTGGGETGPGQAVYLPVSAAGRQRQGDSQRGIYYMLAGIR